MEKMRIFAISITAENFLPANSGIYSQAASVEATEEWAARIRGLEIALESFPISDGYINHQVALCEVPYKFIKSAADG